MGVGENCSGDGVGVGVSNENGIFGEGRVVISIDCGGGTVGNLENEGSGGTADIGANREVAKSSRGG